MKRIYYFILIAIALFSCEKPISEFQSENFIKFFGSGYESKGNDVIELSEGGYLVTGYDKLNTDQQVFAAKVDKNGNFIWSKTYGQAKNIDEGKVVKEVADGYIIAGTSKDAAINIPHSFILKIDFNGEQVYFIEFNKSDYNVTINDILVTDKDIFVAGYSDTSKVGLTDYYFAKLNNLAVIDWEKSKDIGEDCSFNRIFIKDDKLLLVGTDKNQRKMSISPYNMATGSPDGIVEFLGDDNEICVDAAMVGDNLFLLSTEGTSNIKLTKLNSSNDLVWEYKSTGTIKAKSFAYQSDGSIMICGETSNDGLIHFIKMNADGTLFQTENYFRTFSGNVARIIETSDKGLIMVGSTSATYGKNIQLIKTDKDFFMLKN